MSFRRRPAPDRNPKKFRLFSSLFLRLSEDRSGFQGKNAARKPRFVAVGVLFLLVSLLYAGLLLRLRAPGTTTEIYVVNPDGDSVIRTTVPALRGDIYDCNGKLLVTNRVTSRMVFTYWEIPDTSEEFNRSIAKTAAALRATGTELEETLFPIFGTYPDYGYYAEATDGESVYYHGLQTVLSALGLKNDTSCEKLISRMVSRYQLKNSGLSDEEIDSVIRIRYEMLRTGFGVYNDFVIQSDASERLITYVEELNITGVVFRETVTREYCYPGYASHILGQVGKITPENLNFYLSLGYPMDATVGISGCEAAFESYLHGIDGTLLTEKDAEGNILRRIYEIEPVAGQDVYLTIDIDVQIAAEDALKQNIADIVDRAGATGQGADANAGAVVAIDPSDFSVKAIASYPTYDLSTLQDSYGELLKDADLPLLNRALSGTYEPGSTFKIGVALAALEEEIITPATLINDTGIYTYYPGYHPRCWIYTEQGHGHGPIAVQRAITVSCNYFFYDVGRRLGIDRITSYMSRLGLGQKTGIEIGEQTGILASPEYRDQHGGSVWTGGDTLQAAIGQSDNLFTPLQITCYFASVFNRGTRYSAHLFDSSHEFYTGKLLSSYEKSAVGSLSFSEKTYETLLGGILDVVSENAILTQYFSALKASGVTVGGKTGTAQVSESQSDNALFAAYATKGDKSLVSVCVIEHGSSGSYAGYTVSKLMERYFAE